MNTPNGALRPNTIVGVDSRTNQPADQPLVASMAELQAAATRHSVPLEDAAMIALNSSGIAHGDIVYDRQRFEVTSPSGRIHPVALTITDKPFSPFRHTGSAVEFGGESLFSASPLEPDTCTDTYWRDGKKLLTLNSNSRSNCHGCTFCGTYTLDKDDELPLNTQERLEIRAEQLGEEAGGDLSGLESVGVVTGCFANEQKLVDHLQLIRNAFGKHGFDGELRYIGSQLRSPDALKAIIDTGKFALFLTVELFERRKQMMKRTKSSLDLEGGRRVLAMAKDMGAATSFLYIAGLDPLRA